MSYEAEWIVCLIQRRAAMKAKLEECEKRRTADSSLLVVLVRESYDAASRALRRRANALIWG